MSEIQQFKKLDNTDNLTQNKEEIGSNINRNNQLLRKKKTKILNIDKIISQGNFSFSKNKKLNQNKNINQDLSSQRLNDKRIKENDLKRHKKNLTNIYDAETLYLKTEILPEFKKLTKKKLFENKMHRRIQTERQSIEINNKIKKNGNRYVLLKTRNIKKNDGFTTEYLFEGKSNTITNNSRHNSAYINLAINKSLPKKKDITKPDPSLTINNDNKTKNNFCLKSCNFAKKTIILKNRKKNYPIKKRNRNNENIFKTQTKTKYKFNYYSQDNSILDVKSSILKEKMKNLLKFPKRKIYLTSNIGQSFELKNIDNLLSNSNINIQDYKGSFDNNTHTNILLKEQGKNFKNNFFSFIHKKYSDALIGKPKKANSSNFNLKKISPKDIQNIFKNNIIQNNNIIFIKNKQEASSLSEKNHIIKKNIYSNNSNLISNLKHKINKSKEKEKIKILNNKNLENNYETLSLKESVKIKNPLININLKLNNDSKNKIKEFLKNKNLLKHPKKNIIKPKNLIFQSKNILKIESLSKKGFWKPGMDKANQDNYFILNNINNNPNYFYIGVCDGHGLYGKEVSKFIINNLPHNLNENIINNNIKYLSFESIEKLSSIITSSFIQTNNELINNPNINTFLSGSTCTSILFTSRRLISINVGDSRCVLGKFNGEKWQSENLSRDHKPSEEDEKNRIISSGGRVEPNKDEFGNGRGPLRIWMKDEETPGLAVSRSFGDELAHKIGVINEPEIKEYVFLDEDKFFIVASDGLWEYISSEECVDIVKDYYVKNDIEGAINFLYKESSKRWIMEEDVIDDITLVLIFMN